jgi:multidrug efflux pump
VVDNFESILKSDPDIEHWSFYVGSGAIRFYLPLDQQLTNDFFAQAVVVTKGFKVRPAVQKRILTALQRSEFEQVVSRVTPLELGPPVGWPLKFRVSGPDAARVRDFAQSFASLLGNTPTAQNINFDWNEPSKVVRVEVDQDRARALGISSQSLSQTINAVLSGTTILAKLPPDLLASEEARMLSSIADDKVYSLVHLIYRSKHYEGHSKDHEFSRLSMEEYWRAGYHDAMRTLRHPETLQRPRNREGLSTFDLAVDGRE